MPESSDIVIGRISLIMGCIGGIQMYEKLIQGFRDIYGSEPEYYAAAPGRTELSGNHTDHQHGRVLAAAIDLATEAVLKKNGTDMIRVYSEGFGMSEIDINDLDVRPEEKNTTISLIRGIAAYYAGAGSLADEKICDISGFDAYVTSTVLPGSGLSSSAAFEVLIATIMNGLFNGSGLSAVKVAQIGQWAENNYFGKPCGLMDQTASSVGSIIGIDFKDPKSPVVERLDFDLAETGYKLCIIDTMADHSDLTGEYAAITEEMKAVSRMFGEEYLRDVSEADFYDKLAEVRKEAGDRAALRAIHFFSEEKRVEKQVEALKNREWDTFLQLVTESGLSSWRCLQNVTVSGAVGNQEIAFALAYAEQLLAGRGACRVHGGGFAGTIQAFVPDDMTESFKKKMEGVLGEGTCHILSIQPQGGCFTAL